MSAVVIAPLRSFNSGGQRRSPGRPATTAQSPRAVPVRQGRGRAHLPPAAGSPAAAPAPRRTSRRSPRPARGAPHRRRPEAAPGGGRAGAQRSRGQRGSAGPGAHLVGEVHLLLAVGLLTDAALLRQLLQRLHHGLSKCAVSSAPPAPLSPAPPRLARPAHRFAQPVLPLQVPEDVLSAVRPVLLPQVAQQDSGGPCATRPLSPCPLRSGPVPSRPAPHRCPPRGLRALCSSSSRATLRRCDALPARRTAKERGFLSRPARSGPVSRRFRRQRSCSSSVVRRCGD